VTQGSIAIEAAAPDVRRRRERRLLVVGDERAQGLARTARGAGGWAVTSIEDIDAGWVSGKPWDEVVVDAASLEQVRDRHPEILRKAGRVWVVPEDDTGAQAAANPFQHPFPVAGRLVKRTLDIVLSLVGLLLVLPVLIVAMAVVRYDSAGPALFKQVRVGANGRRFRLYKLRSMHHGNDDRAHREYFARLIAGDGERRDGVYKLTDDPRITRVGRFLRRFSIDELPQLWNVLIGDMSLVGPRPPLPHETELYPARAWARLRVRPGVTGPWQVSGRCELSFDEMVALDVGYWQEWSLRRDIAILLKTPKAAVSARGAA
jgi:lipopolysaccharide/colanic/teichoic acid biosynthesis glycosyltransferase